MIGNDSCGVHSVMAGKTVDNVEELDVLLYDGTRLRVGKTSDEELERVIREGGRRGEIFGKLKAIRDRYGDLVRERFPEIPRRVSGYNLDQLLPEHGFHVARALVGTEGTCVTVLEATLNLVHSPPVRSLLVLGYPDVASGCDHVPMMLEHGPIALEGFDGYLVEALKAKDLYLQHIAKLPSGNGWLLVEFGGETKDEAEGKARGLMEALKRSDHPPSMKLMETPQQAHDIWQVRESGLGGTAIMPGKGHFWPGWEDSAVRPDKMGDYLRDLRTLLGRYGYGGAFYGHFGQGCLHTRIDFDLKTTDGIATFRRFMEDAADLVVKYGGSFSGEHGDGQARAELLPKMYGPELVRAFEEFKAIWDPDNRMNPGKMVRPYRMDENLRLGANYNPWLPKTHFQFPDDGGSFANAALRCVGVGKCRRHEAGTMCPSYMATREEMHSTRGRARLLFEMLRGDPMRDGWRDETVREALDLCLACKGCKGDCPVHVDMATYKGEFLAHHYAGRLRPVAAYSMGLIYWWARLASHAPWLANAATHAPVLGDLAKRIGGIAPQREIPAFAPRTFKQWWASRRDAGRRGGDAQADGASGNGRAGEVARKPVILWADTFNNHFHPETAIAAAEVLEAAGFDVRVPSKSLCCGRPLYDFGWLDQAKGLLWQILRELGPDIRAGVPVVGLEPSCVSVFRDELCNLFPHDEDAQRLRRQTYLFSELLAREVPDFQPPKLARKAVVHAHCHHKSVLDVGTEESLLNKLGLDYRLLDSGCCGMAGAFGFEREKYDVSIACGERVLLPAVRAAADDELIITDGFSCREQSAQTTGRRALHVAEVVRQAMHGGELPAERRELTGAATGAKVGAGLAAAALAGLAAFGVRWWMDRAQHKERS